MLGIAAGASPLHVHQILSLLSFSILLFTYLDINKNKSGTCRQNGFQGGLHNTDEGIHQM